MVTINDLVLKEKKERLFKAGAKKLSLKIKNRNVEIEISPYVVVNNYYSKTYYVRILQGFLSNHELITICSNSSTDFRNFQHYGGMIEKLDDCLAVTVNLIG